MRVNNEQLVRLAPVVLERAQENPDDIEWKTLAGTVIIAAARRVPDLADALIEQYPDFTPVLLHVRSIEDA